MKKPAQLVIKIILVLAVLSVLGLLALRLMFPPERIKQMTLNYAKNTLHREIKFDRISFNLIGITLTNFAMSEEDSFANGTFIKADRVEAKAALGPLLKKRVEIATIRIDGLDVFTQKNKDGSFNFGLLSSSEETEPNIPADEKAKSSDEPAFAVTAQFIKIHDCDFYYKDLQSGFSGSLEDIDIQLAHVALDKPFPVTVSLTSQATDSDGRTVSIPVTVNLTVFLANLVQPQAYAEITHTQAQYNHVTFTLQGKVENFENPQVNLSGSLSGVDNTALEDLLPNLPNFALPTLSFALQVSANLQDAAAHIQNLALHIQDSALRVKGDLGWGEETVTYNLNGEIQANIAQLVKMTDDTGFDHPKGTLTATLSATDKKDGKDVRGTLTLQDLSALYPPFALTQTNGTISIKSLDDISCSSLTGRLNNEKFTSSFAYKNIKEVLDLTLKANLEKLTLDKLPFSSGTPDESTQPDSSAAASQTGKEQTYMNINADVTVGEVNIPYFRTEGTNVQAALQRVSADMQKANGTVSFTLQPGAVTDMDTLLTQSKIVKIILLPIGLLNKVGKKLNINLFEEETQAKKGKIDFTKAEGKYTFTNGVMNLDSTTFESELTNLNATGTVDFTTHALDMKVSATLLTKQTPAIIKIGGTMENPTGKLDVLHTVTSIVGGLLTYQTAKDAVTGSADVAAAAGTSAAKATAQVATDTAKGVSSMATGTAKNTANAAKATFKAIGNLFKKSEPTDEEQPATN